MIWKIEVKDKSEVFDAVGVGVKKDILDLGIDSIREVSFSQGYNIEGEASRPEIEKICSELLADKVAQDYLILEDEKCFFRRDEFIVEVAYNPGVMEPVEQSALKGIRDLGINSVTALKTTKKYILQGKLTPAQLKTISEKLLYNKLIQHVVEPSAVSCQLSASSPQSPGYKFSLIIVNLLEASDKELLRISAVL